MSLWAVLRTKRHVATLIGVAALSLTFAGSAFAENDDVDTSISTRGNVSMSVTPNPMTASYNAQSATGSLTLTVDDPRKLPVNWALSEGWYVTMQVTGDFEGSPGNSMTLDADTFKAASISVTTVAGQDDADAPTPADDDTTLGGGSEVTVLSAAVGKGNGAYSATINTEIALPSKARPDTYTGTMVSTLIQSAPIT